MNTLLKQFPLLMLVALLIHSSACTKAKYDDDYTKGDPPPIAGGYVNSREVAKADLVAYWAFDDGYVDSVGGLTGTNSGTSFVRGQKGDAMQVGGSNYFVFDNPGTVIPALNAFSISFWMKTPINTSFGYGIFSLNNPTDFWGSLDVYIDNGSTSDSAWFKVHFNNANAVNSGQFLAVKIGNPWDKWVHMVATYDNSGNFVVYQNGSPVYTTLIKDANGVAFPTLKFPGPTKMVIGTWQFQTVPSLTSGATSQPWAGSFGGALDEFRIYKRALNALEVSALFKLEKQGR